MQRSQLVNQLNELLKPHLFNDYCPNGLQIEGNNDVSHIITGVTASLELIDIAIAKGADTLLVHHGYFWKGEPAVISGMKQARIKKLLGHNINLLAYHLPIDVHALYGNNVQLGQLFNIQNIRPFEGLKPNGIVMLGDLTTPTPLGDFCDTIHSKLKRKPMQIDAGNHTVKTVAWCTGGGQGYIDQLVGCGIDAFISGEISEKTVHSAREQGIHYISAGHHATERYGVKAIGEMLAEQYSELKVEFVDTANPA